MSRPSAACTAWGRLSGSGSWVAVAALFAVLAARSAAMPVDDPDVWWIAAAGRDAIATLAAPTRNTYSYTAPLHPWVMHELLFGVFYAVGLESVGPGFFPLSSTFAATASILLALACMRPRARHAGSIVLGLLLLLAATRGALFAPRPSHASLVLPLAMTALALRPGWTSPRMVAAAALEVLWANTHGSFLLGPVILAVAAVDRRREDRRRCLGAALLALLATAINPYGLRLHALVERYVLGGDATASIIHQHVVEFFPLWRGEDPFLNPFNAAGLGVVVLLSLSALRRRRNVARAAFALSLAALATYQVRHVTLAVVLGAVWVHAEIDDLCDDEGWAPGPPWPAWTAPLALLPGLVLALALWWRSETTRPADAWIADGIGGADFARLARELPEGARVYAPFQTAGLLVWLGAPRSVRVFFDSRNDCYDADVAAAAFALERPGSAAGAAPLLDRYGTDFALLPVTQPAAAALAAAGWTIWQPRGGWLALRRPR